MKTMTNEQAVEWIKSVGLRANFTRKVDLASETKFGFTVQLPPLMPYQIPYFASTLLPGSYEQPEPFLLWIIDNGAPGELAFDIGCRMLSLLRESHGDHRMILESPGYLFDCVDRKEPVDARLLVTMTVLFSWDAYLVPQHGKYFIRIDDDEFVDVLFNEKQHCDMMMEKFKEWNPVRQQC